MAEAKKSGGKGKGISKKLGPLPYWGWAAVGAGTFIVYRYVKARNAASAANAASGLTGGSLIPNNIGLPTATNTPAGNFSSVTSWTQAALAALTSGGMNPADALNAITSFLNGNCVSQAAYNGLGQALNSTSVGLPPGYSAVPTLSVCPSPAQTPTTTNPSPPPATPSIPAVPIFSGLSSTLAAQLANNGETIAATQWDAAANEFILLTNKGGIYNVTPQGNPSGGAFYGSYLGLPAADRALAPGQTRTFTQLIINPDGTYTAVSSTGERYTFNQSIAQLEGV